MLSKRFAFFFPFICFVLLLIFSCKQKKNEVMKTSPAEIIKADEAFSKLSEKEGMKRAFIEYIDNEGILLRPNHLPIIGANAIDFLSLVNDSSFKLTWNPSGAEIAASGELGYTYGVYNLALKDTILKGTCVSIWKKQKDSTWKFVLDTGNEGITQKATSNEQ
jgi:ketosteroid isomerase-like protein